MPSVTWHLEGQAPRTEPFGPFSVVRKVFLKFKAGSQSHQKKVDDLKPIGEQEVEVHISPRERFVIAFDDEASARRLLRECQPRKADEPGASRAFVPAAATPTKAQAAPRPKPRPAVDEFSAFSSQNRLPRVGGYLHGASKSSSYAPPRDERHLGLDGTSGAAAALTAAASSAAAGGYRTPEPSGAAKRLLDRTFPNSDEDEFEAKRRLIDSNSNLATGTPEKPHRMPQRALPPARHGGLLHIVRSAAPVQSSAVYRSYRTTETFGLRNLGNTCYLNAVMQAFCSLREFFADLKDMPNTVSTCSSGELFRCTVDILQQMSNPDSLRGPLNPARLRERVAQACPMFGSNEQQDAHEFFLEYLNQLHDELLGARTRWLADQGVAPEDADGEIGALATHIHLDSEVQKTLACDECNCRRDLRERFRDFSLDFDCQGGSDASLTSMLQGYFASEEVEVKCEHCGGSRACLEKRLELPPRTLVLHLKRFVPNIVLQRYDKQHQRVDIPERLDLRSCVPLADAPSAAAAADVPPAAAAAAAPAPSPVRDVPRPLHRRDSLEIVEPSAAAPAADCAAAPPLPPPPGPPPPTLSSGPPINYSLRSVVMHEGESPHSGHYVCYARSESGAWRLFDDSTVKHFGSEFDLSRLGRQAYILFYVLDTPGTKTL